MAQRDIVVRRIQGARAVLPPLGAPVVIPAVICRTFGKQTADSFELTRSSDNYVDRITNANLVIASIQSAKWVYRFQDKEIEYEYKAGIHFRVARIDANENVIEYLDHNRLYIDDLSLGYGLDWSQAPLLSPPKFSVSVISGGTIPAGNYTVEVYAKSGEAASPNDIKVSQTVPQEVTVGINGSALLITWQKVAYAVGYVVRVKDSQGTPVHVSIVEPDVFSVVIGNFAVPQTLNLIPGAKQVPSINQEYIVNYKYFNKSEIVNKPILYSTLDQVADDHGIGSEAYNVARYVLSPEFGGSPFVMLVAVDEDSPAGYMQALEALRNENVHLIFATYWDMDLFDMMYQHALSLSHPVSGQKERYVVFSHKNGIEWFSDDVVNFLEHFRAFEEKGKRGFFVIFDGGSITLDSWIERDGTVTRDKKVIVSGEDITPIFGAILAFARYCSFRDPASSLTERNVPGIDFVGEKWGDDVYLYLRDKGAFVVRNDLGTPVVDLDINMSYNLLGLNDSQLPIAMTEDWMKQDLRNRLKIFRGKKNIEVPPVTFINFMKLILDNYVASGLITAYDEGSIKVEILSSGLLKGFFKYTPVVIINQILVEYDFEFIL